MSANVLTELNITIRWADPQIISTLSKEMKKSREGYDLHLDYQAI